MTLVKSLLPVVVILILLAMLCPDFSHRTANKVMARTEMADLVNAINAYEIEYKHLPQEDVATNRDVTCGITPADIHDFTRVDGVQLIATNSALIIVLMDLDLGVNASHRLNPKMIKFLNARMAEGTNSRGVSMVDHQYRDPWGHPYVISLDANHDGFVRDAVYDCPALYSNHTPTTLTNNSGIYESSGKVTVWSCGPDGKTSMAVPADDGVNKDNVVSWQ